jgi:hypothetical protein
MRGACEADFGKTDIHRCHQHHHAGAELNAGNYTLWFQAARRSCCVSHYVQPIKVTVDGTQIGSLVSPASTRFTVFSIPFSVATTGARAIAFTGTDPNDKTTFIDGVTVH